MRATTANYRALDVTTLDTPLVVLLVDHNFLSFVWTFSNYYLYESEWLVCDYVLGWKIKS